MNTNKGFDYQRELNEQADTDFVAGGVGSTLKGLGDKVAGLVTAVYAWPNPENGVYPRVTWQINHAIDVITEFAKKYLPIGTIQRGREDWMNCATNASHNETERQHNYAIENKLFSPALIQWFRDVEFINPENGKFESADAFNTILSGTTRNGNSLKAPIQSITNDGIIPKSMLPDSPSMDFDEYHDPTRITQKMKDLGQEYLKRVTIKYEKVYRADFGKVIDKPKWDIFDSYVDIVDGDNIRRLAEDYIFHTYAYRIYLNENDTKPLQINILQRMIALCYDALNKCYEALFLIEEKKTPEEVIEEITIKDPEPPKYLWATPSQACHSVRTICDEEGISFLDKNIIAQTINCESGFHLNATNVNTNGTTDWSLCQYNDNPAYGWIGENGIFKSPEDVIANPEKQVRTMIRCFKSGQLNLWTCYKRGLHEGYSPRV